MRRPLLATLAGAALAATACAAPAAAGPAAAHARFAHVLMISVDGLHAGDLRRYVRTHPRSALAALSAHGVTYTHALTPPPADSFPGLLALVTGGTPAATGVWYDVSYDRSLSPPGSACRTTGTVVRYDEDIDAPGAAEGAAALDTAKLPRDPARGCQPVPPHRYLRVNTIFDVAHAAGLPTAWADKHPAYEILQGPGGHGVDDLWTPEIGANYDGIADPSADKVTASEQRTAAYDRHKAEAVAAWIAGRRHDGGPWTVPAVFGLNLQAVSVAQKRGGYLDAAGRPGPVLARALDDTDHLVGGLVDALHAHGLADSTLVVLTAKHGNGPVDPARLRHVDRAALVDAITAAAGAPAARVTSDDVALVWLRAGDEGHVTRVARALGRQRARLGIARVLWGRSLAAATGARDDDPRRPDLVVVPQPGVIYAAPGDDKRAEHGGFSHDDRAVALLLSNPRAFPRARAVDRPVGTVQVAPTVLAALGLDPEALQAVSAARVATLPGSGLSAPRARR